MKDHSEKQPIDDLFARKLGDMSLKPSADGFERLQARMNQNKPQASRGQSSDQSIDSNASKKTEERTIAPTPIEESLTREELAYSTDTKAIGTSSNKTLPTHRQPKMVSG